MIPYRTAPRMIPLLFAANLFFITPARAYDLDDEHVHQVGNYVFEIAVNGAEEEGYVALIGLKKGYEPEGEITIPGSATINGKKYPVKVIGDPWADWYDYTPAFGNLTKITRVNIPSPVEQIEESEFLGCTAINEFHVNVANEYFSDIDGVLMRRDPFYNPESGDEADWELMRMPPARKKERYTLPAGIHGICDFAFADNSTIKKLVLSGDQNLSHPLWAYGNKGINEIDVSASDRYTSRDGIIFDDYGDIAACPPRLKLDSYTVPTDVKDVHAGAFCNTLVGEIKVHPECSLGEYTFAGSALKKLEFNGPKQYFHEGLCINCTQLTSVSISGKATESKRLKLAENMFRGCASLSDLNIEATHIELEKDVFNGCASLKSFPFNSIDRLEGSELYDGDFGGQFAGTGLTSVEWPEKFERIPYRCFAGCKDLAHVDLDPSGKGTLKQIGYMSFKGCESLAEINFAQVNRIETQAFEGCTSLQKIVFPKHVADDKIDVLSALYFNPETKMYIGNNKYFWMFDYIRGADRCGLLEVSVISSAVSYNAPRDWKTAYVPPTVSSNYINGADPGCGPVVDLFTIENVAGRRAVAIGPNPDAAGLDVEILAVKITGTDAICTDGIWETPGNPPAAAMSVVVDYTVDGVPMASTIYVKKTSDIGDESIADTPETAPVTGVYTVDGRRVADSIHDGLSGTFIVRRADGSAETRRFVK